MSTDDVMAASLSAMGDLQSSPTDLLIAAIKMNDSPSALSLIAQFPDAVHGFDSQDGATPVHWASLFGHADILESLAAEGARLDASIEASGMQPIHWACTQGRLEVVKFLLSRGANINAVDIKQTTPLVIAAQYDHSVLVFHLVKKGADISLLDDCQDSALHWAAYKGNLQSAALLHYLGLPADAADSYGSTPLHLAAARNAPHVIEYLVDEHTSSVEKLVSAKDNKGRTPLDIAKERSNLMAVRLLAKASPTLKTRLMNIFMGDDGSKILWYFYITNATMCYVVYGLVLAPAVGTFVQHCMYLASAVAMQLSYIHVHTLTPGGIGSTPGAKKAYEDAMTAAAEGSLDSSSMPALCHTCRIVKPVRSKHCTKLKACVPMFDHYCPYINNTIGGGNYFSFVRFIFLGMVNSFLCVFATGEYLFAVSMRNPLLWLYLADMLGVLLMALMMNNYHAILIMRNLTTNEDMNKHRYTYLRDDLNKFRNPFSRGVWGNVKECFGRRAVVTANPYFHSELYERRHLDQPTDIEKAEEDTSGDEMKRLNVG